MLACSGSSRFPALRKSTAFRGGLRDEPKEHLRGRLARSGVQIEESGERVKSPTRGKRGEKPLGFFSRVNFSPAFYYANAGNINTVPFLSLKGFFTFFQYLFSSTITIFNPHSANHKH